MIGIKLEGDSDFLELGPDTSISLKFENPILGGPDKLSPGSFSYPFDIPAGDISPSNAAKIKNPDVVENNQAYSLQEAGLYFDGIPFRKGNLKSTTSTKDKASSYFTFGMNTISPDFKTTKLRSVMAESIVIASSDIIKTVYVKKTTGTDFKLSLNGTEYTFPNTLFGIGTGSFATGVDCLAKTLDKPNEWWPVISVGVGPTPGGITGTFLQVNLKQYFTFAPGDIQSRDCTDPLIEMHVALGDGEFPGEHQVESNLDTYFSEFQAFMSDFVSEPYPHDKFRFPVVFNANLYAADAIKQGEGINLFETGSFLMNDPNWGFDNAAQLQVRNYNSIQPFLLLKYVLDRIATVFGFTWTGDFYNHPEVANILLWNTAPLDVPQKYIGESKFVFWKRSINLADLVEDITVVEFLKRIQSRYNLSVFFDDLTKSAKIAFREPIAKSLQYEDITSISSPISNYQSERLHGYIIKVEADPTDLFSIKEELTIGDTPDEIVDIACGRLFNEGIALIDSVPVYGPRVSQKILEKGMTRVFHYAGLIDNGDYTYASALISGPDVPESLEDLHAAFHEIWLLFEKNRVLVKLETAFPLRSLLQFDFELKRRFDRNNYLVKSIDVKLKNTGLEVSSLELYSMK